MSDSKSMQKHFEGPSCKSDLPLISVIVPVYKAEAYLPQCVDSILGQSYSHLELILVDDGSPDKSGQLCDQYAQKDSRVRVLHKENGGASSARNAGITLANGEYFSFVDSDDWVSSSLLSTLYDLLARYKADIAIGEFGDLSNREKYRSIAPPPKYGGAKSCWSASSASMVKAGTAYVQLCFLASCLHNTGFWKAA